METEKGYASLIEAYNKDLTEGSRKKEELDAHLGWVLSRAEAYATLCGTTRDGVLKGWERHRTYWWLNYYQECNQPDPTRSGGTPVVLHADWLKEGMRLYGPNMLDWRLKCPMCGHEQTLRQFKDGGIDAERAITCCASRFRLGGRRDCKWTTGGLLPIGGAYIVRSDCVPVLAFAFADAEPLKERIKVGDAVRIYHGVNKPESRIGEVKEIAGDGTYVVKYVTIDIATGRTTVETRRVVPDLLAVDADANWRLQHGGGVIFEK